MQTHNSDISHIKCDTLFYELDKPLRFQHFIFIFEVIFEPRPY